MQELVIYNDTVTIIVFSLLIFFSRVVDVSIGTLRLIYISRGVKLIPPFLGFFEVLIWLLVVRQIFANLDRFMYYLAYAFGFATGTFVGMWIEDKINTSKVVFRVITKKNCKGLEKILINAKCSSTFIDAKGNNPHSLGYKVKLIFLTVKRKRAQEILGLLRKFDPDIYYSIQDLRDAKDDPLEIPSYPQGNRLRFGFGVFRK